MDTVVNTINTGLSQENLWGVVGSLAPLIITVTLFALGFFLFNRLIKKPTRQKGGAR